MLSELKLLVSIFILLLLSLMHASVTLTSDSLSTAARENDILVVLFYAPWSQDSQDFLPRFEDIRANCSDLTAVGFGKVDVSVEDKLYESEKIENLPTIKIYVLEEPLLYTRQLNEESMITYVRRLATSSLIKLENNIEYSNGFYDFARLHLSPYSPISIIIIDNEIELTNNITKIQEQRDLITNYDFACKKFYSIPCAITTNKTFLSHEIQKLPSIIMIRQFPNEANLDIADESITSTDDILFWIQLAAFPKYSEFTENNEPMIYSLKRLGFSTHIITIINSNIHGHTNGRDITDHSENDLNLNIHIDIYNTGQELSELYRSRAVVTYVDVAESTSYTDEFLDRLDINIALDLPMVLIAQAVDTHVNFYQYKSNDISSGNSDSSITPEQVKSFVQKFFANELFPTSRRRHDLPEDINGLEDNRIELTDNTAPPLITPENDMFEGYEDNEEIIDENIEMEDVANDALLQHLMSS